MGSHQSTRKLTVENENVIQISKDTIERLQTQLANREPVQYVPPPPRYEYVDFSKKASNSGHSEDEAYWSNRIENLKKKHESINNGIQAEYQKALKQTNELFHTVQNDKSLNRRPPCQEEKSKILECYNANPDQSLACSLMVNAFKNCVLNSSKSVIATP